MSWTEIEAKHAERRKKQAAKERDRRLPYWERDYVVAEVRALPEECRLPFKDLVEDYREACKLVHGTALVSIKVLAELARLGWRRQV